MYNDIYRKCDQLGAQVQERPELGGVHFVIIFGNGYGASIVSNPFTYGGLDGKFEFAVIKGTLEEYDLVYDTPITCDVLGWLDLDDIPELLDDISRLDKDSGE